MSLSLYPFDLFIIDSKMFIADQPMPKEARIKERVYASTIIPVPINYERGNRSSKKKFQLPCISDVNSEGARYGERKYEKFTKLADEEGARGRRARSSSVLLNYSGSMRRDIRGKRIIIRTPGLANRSFNRRLPPSRGQYPTVR